MKAGLVSKTFAWISRRGNPGLAKTLFGAKLKLWPAPCDHYAYAALTVNEELEQRGTARPEIRSIAIQHLERCIHIAPDHADSHAILGRLYRHQAMYGIDQLSDNPPPQEDKKILDLMKKSRDHTQKSVDLDKTLNESSSEELRILKRAELLYLSGPSAYTKTPSFKASNN